MGASRSHFFAFEPISQSELQAVMELQRTVAELDAKTDLLISHQPKRDTKLDRIIGQLAFVHGGLCVIGGLLAFLVVAAGLLLSAKISIGMKL